MPKIELAIKEVIDRRAGRRVRQMAIPLRREVRRLRQLVAAVRKDLAALKATAAQWERMADQRLWTATVSDEAANAARLSAGLIRKLRTRFGLSQPAQGRLVGVTGPPWWSGSAAGRSRLETGGRRSRPAEAWAPGREAAFWPG